MNPIASRGLNRSTL